VLVFSLKNEKLKKKLTGHRSQVTRIAYCRNTALIASLSHDQLLIFNESTLIR
jgi:WD40 repeat protein